MEGVATECSNSSDAVKDFEKTKIKLNGEMNGTMETMEVDADSHDSEYKKDSEDDTNDGSSRVNNGGDHSSEGGEHSGEDDSQDADSSHSKLKISENSNSHPGYPNESMEVDGESMNSEEANMLNSDNERSVKSQNIDAEMMEETEEDEDDEERDINKDDNESREAKSNKDVVELDSDHSKSGTEGKHNGECETKKEADSTNSNETTPKKKKENEVVITPRRSSRTVQKPVRFGQDPNNDSSEEEDIQGNDSDEIEEITPQDPLADTLDIRKIPRKIGNTTIVINDTKRLQDIAARASNNQKKEPTLVIIDTNSILSGRGAVPMAQPSSQSHLPAVTVTPQTHLPSHQSSSLPQQPHHIKPYPNLPAALPAQGLYPPPKPVQRPPPPILPTLTDDMYVVEAPSFIVPYVYEKPPVKKFRKYLRKLHKEVKRVDEELKKEEEEEERKEKEKEEKEKEEKEKQEKEKDKEGDKDAKKETDEGDSAKKEEDSEKSESGSSVADKKLEPGENVSADAKVEVKDSEKKVSSSCDSIEDSIKVTEIKKKEDGDVTVKETTPKKIKVGKKEGESSSSDEEDDEEEEKKKPTTGGSYFDNPLGKFFMQIGVNLVQEFVQTDLLKQHKKKQKLGKGTEDTQQAIISLKKNLQISKENNEPYAMEQNKCDYCSFKTESKLIMAHHLETPHMRNYVYRCNFCPLEVRSPHDILMHMEAEHNIRGRLERAPAFHQCPQCPFEDNQKGKLTRHLLTCAKKFRPEKNLEPPLDWEPPAKIPRMTRKPPPNMPINVPNPLYQQAYVTKNMQNPLLPKMVSTLNNQQNAALMRARGRPNFQPVPQGPTPKIISPRPLPPQLIRNMVYRPGSQQTIVPAPPYQITGNQIFQVMGPQGQVMNVPANSSAMQRLGFTTSQAASVTSNPSNQKNPAAVNKLLNHANISITPLPRQPLNGPSTSATTITPRQAGDPKTKHLTCEICEGYVKDLELLRNHMQWIHKVKIHPKMIYNRPPLNCQKCQSRFFTDQGLERHLLGSHGLVTTSMQEDANKGKDGGRCPICGKVYQWKLLNHVSRDHNKTLKPAHLSYKCTVCTATFGMYKQFENHVYSAHSNVAKRVMEKRNGQSSSGVVNRPDTATLLKPLKINDEITIIPQPAKKPTTSSTQPRPVPGISRVSIQPRILPQQSSKPQTDSVQVIDLEDSPLKSSGSMDGGNVESLTAVKERLRRRKSLEIRQVESEPDHSEGESEDYERESTSRSKVNSANEEEDEDSRTENENTKGNDDDEEDEDDDERNPDKGHEDENDESDG